MNRIGEPFEIANAISYAASDESPFMTGSVISVRWRVQCQIILMKKLIVLYPQPKDKDKFDLEYDDHVSLFHEKMDIPIELKKVNIAKTMPGPDGTLPVYSTIFTFQFDSDAELKSAMENPNMNDLIADSFRVSTGGEPTILVAEDWELK